MKTSKVVEAHVEQKVVTDSVTCDCCGAVRKAFGDPGPVNWSDDNWRSEFGYISGRETIEGDSEYIEADICYRCAEWLIDQLKRGQIRRPK